MATFQRLFLKISLAALAALANGACSDDSNRPPEELANQPEQESPEPTLQPPGGTSESPVRFWVTHTNPKDWTLHVSNGSYFSKVLPRMYREQCLESEGDEAQCEALHALLVVEATMALEEIERSADQRGTQQALAALELTGEPEILIAALRILGRFPDTPGIAEKVWPLLLESPYLEVQQMAAQVLAANPDPTLSAMGSYWGGNHGTLYAENEYQEYPDFPPHYAGMGFPEYPGAEWFSPADSDRSVGWWTSDDFPTVTAWLAGQLGIEGLDYQGWGNRLGQESMAVFQAIDPAKEAEVARLIDEFSRTQDMAVLEKMTKLQQEMYAPVEEAGKVAELGVSNLGPPSTNEAMEQVRFFVAEERGGHVARLVIVYPIPALGHTGITHAWSLADYPSAWPPEANPAGE